MVCEAWRITVPSTRRIVMKQSSLGSQWNTVEDGTIPPTLSSISVILRRSGSSLDAGGAMFFTHLQLGHQICEYKRHIAAITIDKSFHYIYVRN